MDKSLYVNLSGINGNLTLSWSSDVSVLCDHISKNIMDSVVQISVNGEQMFVTWIYGDPKFVKRTHNWNRLRGIDLNRRDTWISMGDFNDISQHSDKVGGRRKDQ